MFVLGIMVVFIFVMPACAPFHMPHHTPQMRSGLKAVQASLDSGPHRRIRNMDLQIFWRTFYGGQSQVVV